MEMNTLKYKYLYYVLIPIIIGWAVHFLLGWSILVCIISVYGLCLFLLIPEGIFTSTLDYNTKRTNHFYKVDSPSHKKSSKDKLIPFFMVLVSFIICLLLLYLKL